MKPKKNVVLITGASSGIGKAIAGIMASKGDMVFAGARKEKDIELLDQYKNVQGIKLDVRKSTDIENVIQKIKDTEGHLDCLVNNAGVMGWGAIIDRDIEYFKNIFEVNMWGTISVVKAAYPLLKKSPFYPAVFNISSQGANYTFPFWSPYHMSKYAMEAFTGSLRHEFMSVGIRVFSIAPGAFKSEMLSKQQEELDSYEKKFQSDFSQKVVKMLRTPVKKDNQRGQSPEIIGELIYKILHSKKSKARYQPGKRLIPDVLFEKMPMPILDKIIMKAIK